MLVFVHDAAQLSQPLSLDASVDGQRQRSDPPESASLGPRVEIDCERSAFPAAVDALAILREYLPGCVAEVALIVIEPFGDPMQVDVDALPTVRIRCVVLIHRCSPEPFR